MRRRITFLKGGMIALGPVVLIVGIACILTLKNHHQKAKYIVSRTSAKSSKVNSNAKLQPSLDNNPSNDTYNSSANTQSAPNSPAIPPMSSSKPYVDCYSQYSSVSSENGQLYNSYQSEISFIRSTLNGYLHTGAPASSFVPTMNAFIDKQNAIFSQSYSDLVTNNQNIINLGCQGLSTLFHPPTFPYVDANGNWAD